VQKEYNIDIGGNGVRFSSLTLETCPTDKRTASGKYVLNTLQISRGNHPITYCHLGSDIANPQCITAQTRRPKPDRAPPSIKTRNPTGTPMLSNIPMVFVAGFGPHSIPTSIPSKSSTKFIHAHDRSAAIIID
jgi:hypothetical protein